MDFQEQAIPNPKEAQDFKPQQHLTPLENYAISASVEIVIDGKKVLVGEGKEAVTVQQLVASHPELVSLPAGVTNGVKTVDEVNVTRKAKFKTDSYLGMYGPRVMMEMMLGKTTGGLLLEAVKQGEKGGLTVFLKNEDGDIQNPPDLTEDFSGLVEYSGNKTVTDPAGHNITALVYTLKKQ